MRPFTYSLPGFKGYSAIENRNKIQAEQVTNFWVRENSLQVRDGCAEQIGTATITYSLESIAMLKTKAGDKYLLGASSKSLYLSTGSLAAWGASLKNDCDNAVFDAVSFRDAMYLGNGSNSLKYDGATLSSVITDTPYYDSITTWKGRLFANKLTAPTYGFYSDPGVVTNLNVNFQSIAENDSDEVVGAVPVLNFLLILNRYSAYSFYGTTPQFQKPKTATVGTIARRSIVNINEIAYWLSDNGVYSYGGGTVRPVAFELGDITKIINFTYADKACGIAWHDYYLLACPESAQTTNTQILAYDTTKGEWTQQKFPFSINQFVTDGDNLYASATNGKLYKLFGGATSDAGASITATWVSDALSMDRPGMQKRVKNIAIELADIASAGTVSVYLKEGDGAYSSAYDVAIPTASPGDTVVIPVQTQKFYNLTIKLTTTAKATINNITFGGKYKAKVK